MAMLERLFPKEKNLFPLFTQITECLNDAANLLAESLENPSKTETNSQKIREIENRADGYSHKVIHQLHESFVTPFDRMHIQQLVSSLDEIVDLVYATSERLYLYDVKNVSADTLELGRKCQEISKHINHLIPELQKIKTPKEALRICVDIHRVENEADHILRTSLKNLFQNETDWKDFIKHKEVNEMLENITDRAEHVANLVEGIVLEYA